VGADTQSRRHASGAGSLTFLAVPDDAIRRVGILTEVAAIEKNLDYELPSEFAGPTSVGSRVRVPLHGRSVKGWIVSDASNADSQHDVKKVKASLGFGPPSELIDLARWAAWRWASQPARFLSSASPETIVRSLPTPPRFEPSEAPTSPLGVLGIECARDLNPSVIRVGPVMDPFDILLGMVKELLDDSTLPKSLLVLVPGKGYSRRLVARLSRRGVPAVDLADGWPAARAGWPVVVGTRSACFAPVPHLAGILILDGEDSRFFSEGAPTWNVIDMARQRSLEAKAPCVVVSSTPTALVMNGATLRELDQTTESAHWPRVEVVDLREEDPRSGMLSSRLIEMSRAALDAESSEVAVACIVNRKGRARLVACRRCSEIARCENCESSCVLDEKLECPRCGTSRPVICRSCGATAMKLLRLGTAQLAVELQALLGVNVKEITATSGPDALKGARALVGTEAILSRVRHAKLVALLDFDHHLLAPRAGAEISALTLIGRAGRLVGGRTRPESGAVLIQTRLLDHPVVVAAEHGDPHLVVDADVDLRRQLHLPPFGSLARLKGPGALEYATLLEAKGCQSAPLGETEFLVQAKSTTALSDCLAGTPRPKAGVRVGVDPESV